MMVSRLLPSLALALALVAPLLAQPKYSGPREMGMMRPSAVLINTCRGPVVDENALMTALDDGTIAGAAMDVIEREPPPQGHRLLSHHRQMFPF